MLYNFFTTLTEVFSGFNVFKYITVRIVCAACTSFLISILFGKWVIEFLRKWNYTQQIRSEKDAPGLYKLHKDKVNTPTMGGLLIIGSIVCASLLWANLSNMYVMLCIIAMLWLAGVGFLDDFLKIHHKKSKGLGKWSKLIGQVSFALIVGYILYTNELFSSRLDIPFFKNVIINLGILFIPFVVLVIVGTSNAVNLTDGLDGLAIGCVIVIALTFCGLSYVTGNSTLSEYLNIIFLPHAGELAVFCAAIVGAGIGFLWFNSYPATVFMGDTGSLALGGAIGVLSVLIKKEILLLLVGGIFVFEAVSVIIQIISVRIFKRKFFLMAPFHHHLQMKGWSEPKIIIRFWIIAIILSLLSLITLKLR